MPPPTPTTPAWASVCSACQPSKRSLAYLYNALGVLESTTLPGGQTLNFPSNGSGHLHQINWNGQGVTDIERNALHRETARNQDPYQHIQRLRDIMDRVRCQLCDAPAGEFLLIWPDDVCIHAFLCERCPRRHRTRSPPQMAQAAGLAHGFDMGFVGAAPRARFAEDPKCPSGAGRRSYRWQS